MGMQRRRPWRLVSACPRRFLATFVIAKLTLSETLKRWAITRRLLLRARRRALKIWSDRLSRCGGWAIVKCTTAWSGRLGPQIWWLLLHSSGEARGGWTGCLTQHKYQSLQFKFESQSGKTLYIFKSCRSISEWDATQLGWPSANTPELL